MKLGKEFLEEVANLNYPKPQTNADRIRQMSDEELAEWMCIYACRSNPKSCKLNMSCRDCWLEWLKWLKSPEVSND